MTGVCKCTLELNGYNDAADDGAADGDLDGGDGLGDGNDLDDGGDLVDGGDFDDAGDLDNGDGLDGGGDDSGGDDGGDTDADNLWEEAADAFPRILWCDGRYFSLVSPGFVRLFKVNEKTPFFSWRCPDYRIPYAAFDGVHLIVCGLFDMFIIDFLEPEARRGQPTLM